MAKFTYNRGTWDVGSVLPIWEDHENGDEYVERLHYSTSPTRFGHPHGSQIEVYESMVNDSFLALVTLGSGSVHEVYLPDFPSMMEFIKDHGAGFSTDSINTILHNLSEVMDKLFQAQHGHPSHDICSKCNPEGWKDYEEYRSRQSK